MKLNNHGWGLREMLIYMAILIFFFGVAVFFIIQLSEGLGDSFKNNIHGGNTYGNIEENVKESALRYIEQYYETEVGTGTITVSTSNLIRYQLLSEFDLKTTEKKDSCHGYALIKKENDLLVSSPYITCADYETIDYQSWRIGE